MKINVRGKANPKGISKKGAPFDFIQLHYRGRRVGVVGEAAITITLDPAIFNYDEIVVPGDYLVEFDDQGRVLTFAPAVAK